MASELQLVVVTPETTFLDEPVESLQFPLFDGQAGVLPGRAPLVGRLGCGELHVRNADGERSYFLDGGFVQITGETVTLLTARCIPSADIDTESAKQSLNDALSRPAASEAEIESRFQDQERARRMIGLKR